MSEQENVDGSRKTSSVWWLVSAAVIVLVLVGLGFVLLSPAGDGQADPAPAPSTPAASSSATSEPSTGQSSDCQVQGGDQSVPRKAPKTDWDLVEGIALPKSEAGPGRTNGVVRSCFARTAEGALFAASTFAVSTQLDDRVAVYQARISPGPEKEAALSDAKNAQPQDGDRLQIAGFRVVSYTKEQAVIAVAMRRGSSYVIATYPLVWQGGDWLVDGNPPGGYQPPQTTADLTGYIAWRGV